MRFFRKSAFAGMLFLCGCAATMPYRAEDVPDEPIPESDRLSGRDLIYTTETDDDRRISAGSTSFTGSGLKLTTSVGVMAREIALKVFSRAASGGADESHDLAGASRYAIVVRPEIENFEYGFPHPKHLGLDVKPEIRMTLRITLLDETGRVLFEKDYDSGAVSGTHHLIVDKVVDRTDRLTHEVIYDLMRRAVADVHMYQKTEAAAAERSG
ncbi:MAG: hypothetical protein JOZ17_11330 [Acetobacteraceae bacterium]|nr:hypothetical protein [Acetobacteraceae bacterium]